MRRKVLAAALSLPVLSQGAVPPAKEVVVGRGTLEAPWQDETRFRGVIKGQKVVDGCHMPTAKRHVEDGFIEEGDVRVLVQMVEKGMAFRKEVTGGPTILDINSGFLKDGMGLANIYEGHNPVTFTQEEYKVYGNMFDSIRKRIMEVNGLDSLYFTAPTFVARTVGNEGWVPQEPHDEYWHPHVDKDNTFHYDYSGLVYLADYGTDFEGGEFEFLDSDKIQVVLPKRGRFITFASGRENPHKFNKVTRGTRYAFSMWFTCNKSLQFRKFLDGKLHETVLKDEL